MIRMDVTAVGLNNILQRLEMTKIKVGKEVQKVFEDSKDNIVKNSKRIVRVKTGRLKRSIKGRVTNKGNKFISIYAGTDVPYSIYIERRYPYLFPSFEAEKPRLIRNLRRIKLN